MQRLEPSVEGMRKNLFEGVKASLGGGQLMQARRVLAAVLTSALLVGGVSSPALAVNDPLVPGDDCAPDNAQAVGHPALAHQQPQGANPPFSLKNPGVSTGAQGSVNSDAPCDA